MARKALRVGVSLVLTAVLAALFLWNVDLAEVARTVGTARPKWLALGLLFGLLSYWLRAVRWQLILRPLAHVRHSSAVLATAAGYAAMFLLPARLGDIIRPLLLARREPVPAMGAIASILTERIFDLWTVLVYFVVFVVWPPDAFIESEGGLAHFAALRSSGWAVAVGLVAGTALIVGLLRYQERFVSAITAPVAWIKARWRAPAASLLNHFLDGLRVLRRPRDLAVTVGASLLVWFVIYWQITVTLYAFDVVLPLRASFFLVILAVIGLAIPTPGGVGGFHKATQIGLTLFLGVELNRASAFAIVHHAICFLPITAIGLLSLPAFGTSLREVAAKPPGQGDAEPVV